MSRDRRLSARKRLRVLWVSLEAPHVGGQGGQRRQYWQLDALVADGNRVLVVVPRSDQSTEVPLGVRVVRTPRLPRGTALLARAIIAALMVVWRPSVAVVSHAESFPLVKRLSRTTRVPLVVDFHNVQSRWFEQRSEGDLAARWRTIERAIGAEAQGLTVCSGREREALSGQVGTTRIEVAPNGVAASEWPPDARQQARGAVVAAFGSWWYPPNRDGLSWFVREVWPAVLEAVPTARLLVAGGAEVEILLTGVPSSASVGRVDDLAYFLGAAQLVVVPVQGGPGTPLKFGESLASGAAVVATSHAAASYGRTDFCAVTDEPDEFARQCVRLLQDPVAAAALGRAGAEFALSDAEWRSTSAPLIDLLRDVAGLLLDAAEKQRSPEPH